MSSKRPALIHVLILVVASSAVVACASSPARYAVGAHGRGSPDEGAYFLPFPAGTRARCVQTGPGPFSHQGSQAYAVDFKMAEGSVVVAARGGRVVAVKQDSDRGGPSRAFADDGNYVRILHADGTRATYLHLQKDGARVRVGDVVVRGQEIARSGNTGWSAMPHLHVQVDRRDTTSGRWSSIPLRFADIRGDGRPALLMVYESGNVGGVGAADGR